MLLTRISKLVNLDFFARFRSTSEKIGDFGDFGEYTGEYSSLFREDMPDPVLFTNK